MFFETLTWRQIAGPFTKVKKTTKGADGEAEQLDGADLHVQTEKWLEIKAQSVRDSGLSTAVHL